MNVARPAPPLAGVPDPAPETFGAVETLAGVSVAAEDLAGLQEVRLTAAVAAALRAALDWLGGETGFARPLRARADDAALEIVLEHLDGRALRASGEVLAGVGGSLGRVESVRPDAPWVVRVPIHAAREQFLMVIEGGLPLAFAWPSVIHIVMANADELSAGLTAPRLPALVEGAGPAPGEAGARAAEHPVVLLGLGLKRGYYVAERLVWRLPAVPIETVEPPPLAGLSHAVQTEEGECYWVADPAWLLQSVGEPALDVPPATGWTPPEPVRALGEADICPIESHPDEVEPTDEPESHAAPAIPSARERTVGPTYVPEPRRVIEAAPPAEPLAPVQPAASAQPAVPAQPPPAQPEPPAPDRGSVPRLPDRPDAAVAAPDHARAPKPPARPDAAGKAPAKPASTETAPAARGAGLRAALVAEDSITASIFLARLLEQHGFLVRTVDTAAELAHELKRGDWTLVCVDVELPDGRGRDHLRAVREAHERAHAAHPGPAALVALVRDPEDVAEAQAAGISRVLRKPFDKEALVELLRRVGVLAGGVA